MFLYQHPFPSRARANPNPLNFKSIDGAGHGYVGFHMMDNKRFVIV